MVKKETERGRLARERILAQDEVRRAADKLNRAVFAELASELADAYDLDCDFHVSGDKTVGLTFDLRQAQALLNVMQDLAEDEV